MKRALTYMQIAQREEILRRLALGETLRGICRSEPELPDESTVRSWAFEEPDGFGPQYERARMLGYHSMVDEVVDAARTVVPAKKKKRSVETKVGLGGQLYDAESESEEEYDAVDRSRLVVDTLKWLVGKTLPKMYGDKLNLQPPDPGDDSGGYTVTIHKLPAPDAKS